MTPQLIPKTQMGLIQIIWDESTTKLQEKRKFNLPVTSRFFFLFSFFCLEMKFKEKREEKDGQMMKFLYWMVERFALYATISA